MKNDNFLLSFAVSITLHLLVIYFFLFGLPAMRPKKTQEQIITFEMVDVGDINNIKTQVKDNPKPSEVPIEEAKKVLESKKPVEPEKPITTPPKPAEKDSAPIKKEPVIDKVKEAPPLTTEKPTQSKPAEDLSNTPKEEIKTQEEPKSEVPKEIKKEETPKTDKAPLVAKEVEKPKKEVEQPKPKEVPKSKKDNSNNELESLLKNLEQTSDGTNNKSNKTATKTGKDKISAQGTSNGSDKLSITEFNLIKRQIQNSWNVPAGAAGAENVLITLYISFEKSGKVSQVKMKNHSCPGVSNNVCQAIADSAVRAVWSASPINGLRPENYNRWQELNIEFDPSEILR